MILARFFIWQLGTFLFCRQLGTLLGNWRFGAL